MTLKISLLEMPVFSGLISIYLQNKTKTFSLLPWWTIFQFKLVLRVLIPISLVYFLMFYPNKRQKFRTKFRFQELNMEFLTYNLYSIFDIKTECKLCHREMLQGRFLKKECREDRDNDGNVVTWVIEIIQIGKLLVYS